MYKNGITYLNIAIRILISRYILAHFPTKLVTKMKVTNANTILLYIIMVYIDDKIMLSLFILNVNYLIFFLIMSEINQRVIKKKYLDVDISINYYHYYK